MLRYRGRLSPEMELLSYAIGIGLVVLPFLLGMLARWLGRRKLRKFYEANEYRAFGEILNVREVFSAVGQKRWELKVRYRNDREQEKTAVLTTCNPEVLQRKNVELALLPSSLLPTAARERLHNLTDAEKQQMTYQEKRTLWTDAIAEMETERKQTKPYGFPLEEMKAVRLWEERYTTTEEYELRKQNRKRAVRVLLLCTGVSILFALLTWWTAEK